MVASYLLCVASYLLCDRFSKDVVNIFILNMLTVHYKLTTKLYSLLNCIIVKL